jgi:hypothetical protein
MKSLPPPHRLKDQAAQALDKSCHDGVPSTDGVRDHCERARVELEPRVAR